MEERFGKITGNHMSKKVKNDFKNARFIPEERLKHIHKKIIRTIGFDNSINLGQISKTVDKSIPNTSIHLKNLEYSGYVKKHIVGQNRCFNLTERGQKVQRCIENNTKITIRTHDVVFTFPITRVPKDWANQCSYIINNSMRGWSKQLTKGINEKVFLQINGNKSISVTVKEIIGNTPEGNVMEAFRVALDVVLEIIKENKGLVIGKEARGYVLAAKVSRQSHAFPNDVFASHCFRLIGPYKGKYIEIDRSVGIPEIEFTDPCIATHHASKYLDHIREITKK